MNQKVTLKVLAELLGYSQSTISKALNDSHEISTHTKKIIRRAATSLDYQPNFLARNLKKQNNDILKVSIPGNNRDVCISLLQKIKNLDPTSSTRGDGENGDNQFLSTADIDQMLKNKKGIILMFES